MICDNFIASVAQSGTASALRADSRKGTMKIPLAQKVNIASVAQSGTASALRADSRKGISVQIRALASLLFGQGEFSCTSELRSDCISVQSQNPVLTQRKTRRVFFAFSSLSGRWRHTSGASPHPPFGVQNDYIFRTMYSRNLQQE